MKKFNPEEWCYHSIREEALFSNQDDILLAYSILLVNIPNFVELDFCKIKIEVSKQMGLKAHYQAASIIIEDAKFKGIWN